MKLNKNQLAEYISEFNKHLDYIKLILGPYRDLIEIEQDLNSPSGMINVYKNNKDQQQIISIVKRYIRVK